MDNNLVQESKLQPPFRILVIAAHHDDIEFGTAGSVAVWTDQGAEVTYCIVTDGSAGSNDPAVNPAELVDRRRAEQIRAAQIVGVNDVRFLGYRDGTLQPTLELRRDLTRLIREIKPDRVVCSDPTMVFSGDSYINHPDHRAAAEAAVYAVFPSAETRPIFPELLDEGYEPHRVTELYMGHTYQATLFVDISTTLERKLRALACHVSQLGEGEDFKKGAGKWVRKYSTEAGKKHGVGAVEEYRVMRINGHDEEDDEEEHTAPVETEAVSERA